MICLVHVHNLKDSEVQRGSYFPLPFRSINLHIALTLRGVCWQLNCTPRIVILNGKYKILISLILQWQVNPRKTMRNLLSLIIGICGLTINHDMLKLSQESQKDLTMQVHVISV